MSQVYEPTEKSALFDRLAALRNDGFTLAQILAARLKSADKPIDVIYAMERGEELICVRVPLDEGEGIESVTGLFPYAYLYENEMKDLFGIDVKHINIDFNGTLYITKDKPRPIETGDGRTIVPFGPQHPVLPEPIHLDLVLEDETVAEAVPSIGFVHRGLEKLVEKKDFIEYTYVAERICGICSFIHGMGYCMAVENVLGVKPPERAEFLRVMWSELSRVHSHLLWLGLLADAVGFESLFMHSWRLREKILDLFDMTTGGRVIFSVCKIGGVRRDVGAEKLKAIVDVIDNMEAETRSVTDVFLKDSSVKSRLAGLGAIKPEEAIGLGAVGPVLRASGVDIDMRRLKYSAYEHIKFESPIEKEGDSLARTKARIRELFESFGIIRQCADILSRMGEGGIETAFKGNPTGEYMARLEQPRGQVLYYVNGDGSKNLARMRVRTPTLANIPALLHMLKGAQLADVPVLVLTIDPCISCTER